MNILVLSDTHTVDLEVLRQVVAEGIKRGAELVIHCGDISSKHLQPELFGNLPVVCALTKKEIGDDGMLIAGKESFAVPPPGWVFTKPGARIYALSEDENIYVGHNLSFEFLQGSEDLLDRKLQEIRNKYDCVRWLFSGHTHHQIYKQGRLISFVNPGAVYSFTDGYEFVMVNTETREIVFCRVLNTIPTTKPFSIGLISDSMNISEMDPTFWGKLAGEFKRRDVTTIIHCGNIDEKDIGRPELADFKIHFNLIKGQKYEKKFDNWILINQEHPIVDVGGHIIYVQWALGADLLEKSERDMKKICLGLKLKYDHRISCVVFGFTNEAFLEEGEECWMVNPGDVIKDRNFAVICFPRIEVTFKSVPIDLPTQNS